MKRRVLLFVVALFLMGASAPSAPVASPLESITRGKRCWVEWRGGRPYYTVCAWINVDYVNHRMRAYGRIDFADGRGSPYVQINRVALWQYSEPAAIKAASGSYREGYGDTTSRHRYPYNCPTADKRYVAEIIWTWPGGERTVWSSKVIRTNCRN
jgi:hypothetical protein